MLIGKFSQGVGCPKHICTSHSEQKSAVTSSIFQEIPTLGGLEIDSDSDCLGPATDAVYGAALIRSSSGRQEAQPSCSRQRGQGHRPPPSQSWNLLARHPALVLPPQPIDGRLRRQAASNAGSGLRWYARTPLRPLLVVYTLYAWRFCLTLMCCCGPAVRCDPPGCFLPSLIASSAGFALSTTSNDVIREIVRS